MTRTRQLNTVSEVIDALGGTVGMIRLFGGTRSRFSNYRANDAFPKAMHMQIYEACKKRDLSIAPELIGMTEEAISGAHQQPPVAAE